MILWRVAVGWLCMVLLNLPATACAQQVDVVTQEQELKTVRKRIQSLQNDIGDMREQTRVLHQELRQNELETAQTLQRLEEIHAQIQTHQQGLESLKQQREQLRTELSGSRQKLGVQIRVAFLLGRNSYLKLLMNQQNPSSVDRLLAWHGYHTRERSRRIADMRTKLSSLDEIGTHINDKSELLLKLQDEERTRLAKYEDTRMARVSIIAALQQELGERGDELRLLKRNEQELVALLDSLSSQSLLQSGDFQDRVPFASLQGELAWPVRGRLLHRFGQPHRQDSSIRWNGVLIDAPPGTAVNAVGNGKVVFADWFRGQGLLLIVEHGDGYMSLYGRNRRLLKKTGDWVLEGENVASTGDSGGQDVPGLYFELRRNGIPLDPASWCR